VTSEGGRMAKKRKRKYSWSAFSSSPREQQQQQQLHDRRHVELVCEVRAVR
jgi:hypothetical protein